MCEVRVEADTHKTVCTHLSLELERMVARENADVQLRCGVAGDAVELLSAGTGGGRVVKQRRRTHTGVHKDVQTTAKLWKESENAKPEIAPGASSTHNVQAANDVAVATLNSDGVQELGEDVGQLLIKKVWGWVKKKYADYKAKKAAKKAKYSACLSNCSKRAPELAKKYQKNTSAAAQHVATQHFLRTCRKECIRYMP